MKEIVTLFEIKKYHFFAIQLGLLISGSALFSEPNFIIDTSSLFSLNGIRISNDNSVFYPSNFGGICVLNEKGEQFQPWSQNIKFKSLKKDVRSDSYSFEWIMYKENDFYFHYEITIYKERKSIKVHLRDLGVLPEYDKQLKYATAYALVLDRCEGSINPVIIGIPYLTTFNVLYSNNCFVSMFFDWNKTNASQIIQSDKVFSKSSVYYSQYAVYNSLTNGKRNQLDETIYLKVSDNIDDVLPNLPNPISKFKNESSSRIIFDDWNSFNSSYSNISKLSKLGLQKIWHIVHNWQRYGYDVKLPDVFPANEQFGGNDELRRVCEYDKELGYLFALHENYVDIYKASSKFGSEDLALNSNGKYIFNWFNGDTSFIVKPTRIFSNLTPISNQIKEFINPNSVYHDVSASYDPSKYVDYDYSVSGAGKFMTPYTIFKALADTLRRIYNGPVSSEGLAHFLYVGYFDDICAQIHTAQSLPGSYGTETQGGFYKPLLVDFDLLKMKEKATVHGVGYYERFFYKDNYWQYMGRSKDSALMYAATELAYGHGAFFSSESYNMIEQALIEYNYVYPVQLIYSASNVSRILYNDNGEMLTASDYIRRHSNTFDKFNDDDFMAQVMIEYDNGLRVFVNRHPSKNWPLALSHNKTFVSAHCLFGKSDSLFCGVRNVTSCSLPINNGWYCYLNN